jgi:exodeoxyribonuclease-3
MKISTWNVNGIRAREAQVMDWVERERPDVLCLQEIKASPEHIPPTLSELEGYWCCWHGHKGYSGVGLHLAKAAFPFAPAYAHPEFDHENRVVTVEIEDLTIASMYVPNGNKDYPAKLRFLEALERWVVALHASGRRLVLCGDLNVALADRDVHPKLRKPEQVGQSPEEQALLERIIGHGLVDLLRRHHPDDDRLFTWWAPWRNLRERNIGWRLDYVLASDAVAAHATSCDAVRDFGTSDHGPVTAIFDDPLVTMTGPAPAPEKPAAPPPAPAPGQLSLFGDSRR